MPLMVFIPADEAQLEGAGGGRWEPEGKACSKAGGGGPSPPSPGPLGRWEGRNPWAAICVFCPSPLAATVSRAEPRAAGSLDKACGLSSLGFLDYKSG